MKQRRFSAGLLALVGALAFAPRVAPAQGTSPIDDLIKRAINAFDDLQYMRADSLARSVLQITTASSAQRVRAMSVMAAANFPEEAAGQHRTTALTTLKNLMKQDYSFKMPTELTWAGLDSLVEEARRTTFGVAVSAEQTQTAVGVDGTAKVHFKANRPGFFRLIISSKVGNNVAVVDSITGTAEGDISFKTMRDEKPIFTSGDYSVLVVGYDPGARSDTVTATYGLRVDAPALAFAAIPNKMDSTKLLPERAKKFGMKAILPAILVGGAVYALSAVVHGEGLLSTQGAADGKGMGVAAGATLATILAGFTDRGSAIPANIAANKAAGEAFQKSIVDAQAENRRRILEHKTVLTFDMTSR